MPVNLGNPSEFTILECAQAVLDVTGSKSELCFCPFPRRSSAPQPDISRARKLLNWEPRIQLKEGLKRSLKFFSSHLASGW